MSGQALVVFSKHYASVVGLQYTPQLLLHGA